jgi:hypothetical protein
MKATHDRILDLPTRKAKQSRPTRDEILEGIGYTPLTFPASRHVPEALRAQEERANQDYIVAWVQGLGNFIHAHENDPDPSTKLAQNASAGRPRAGRARAKASSSRDQPNPNLAEGEPSTHRSTSPLGNAPSWTCPTRMATPSGSACGEPKEHAVPF